MSQLSKQALKVENNTSFPNNNTNYITPAILRDFNVDMIDSMVDEIPYGAYTQSVDASLNALNVFTASASGLTTGSLLITASATGNVITFTKGNNTTFNVTVATGSIPDISNLNQATASLQAYTASANVKFSNLETTTASLNTSVSNINTFTASTAISITNLNSVTASQQTSINQLNAKTGSYATTGSNTFVSANTFTSISASSFVSASEFIGNGSKITGITASISMPILDEGIPQGNAVSLNFTGSAIGATVIGGVAIISVNGLDTGSYNALTQSFNSYTASTNLDLAAIHQATASLQQFTASFNTASFVGTASFNSYTSSTNTATASLFTSASLALVTASVTNDDITFTKGDGTQFTIQVATGSFALSSSYAETASVARNIEIIARNGNASTLAAGTVVHITGASGDNPIFTTASYDNEALSSNTLGILRYSSVSGADVQVIVNGIVTGVNTDPTLGYAAGDIIYLSSSGQFTKVQPQAPNQIVTLGQVLRAQQNNGSIYVSINNGWELNELHNVQITTSSLATNQLLAYESASYGLWKNKSFSQLGLATTGSNTFNGTEIISGGLLISASGTDAITINNGNIAAGGATVSANIFQGNYVNLYNPNAGIGLSLNAAGSGSQYPQVNTNVDSTYWPNDIFGGFQIQDPSLGYFTFGAVAANSYTPEYPGQVVGWIGGGANNANGSNTAIIMRTGSANLEIYKPIVANFNLNVIGSLTSSLQEGYTWVGNGSNVSTLVATSSFGGGGTINTGSFATTGSNSFNGNQTITGSLLVSGSSTSDIVVEGQLFISSSTSGSANGAKLTISGAAAIGSAGNRTSQVVIVPQSVTLTRAGASGTTVVSFSSLGNITTSGPQATIGAFVNTGSNAATITTTFSDVALLVNNELQMSSNGSGNYLKDWDDTLGDYSTFMYIAPNDGVTIPNPQFLRSVGITGSLEVSSTLTASLQQGYTYVGNSSGKTTTVATSSFGTPIPTGTISGSAQITALGFVSSSVTASSLVTASVSLNTITFTKGDASTFQLTVDTGSGGGGAAFPFTGDAVITGSLLVSGSGIPDVRVIGNVHITGSLVGQPITLSVASSTASLNMTAGNNFILTLPSSSTTHITATNIVPGQTLNLLIKQQVGPATGSITFAPTILFPSGLDMQATATGSAIDLVSMISFDTTNLMAANVKNLK